MGWFSRKTPASEGLASVAISSALAACDSIADRGDALRLAAFMVGYVSNKRHQFGVPAGKLDHLIRNSMLALTQRGFTAQEIGMSYFANATAAERIAREPDDNGERARYFEAVGPWNNQRDDVLRLIQTSQEAADILVVSASSNWKLGR